MGGAGEVMGMGGGGAKGHVRHLRGFGVWAGWKMGALGFRGAGGGLQYRGLLCAAPPPPRQVHAR